MRLLVDTHVVLWLLEDSRDFTSQADEALAAADEVLVSVISFLEIGIKASIGKLRVPGDLVDRLRSTGLSILGLAPEHGLGVAGLPLHHRDPFDRLLVAQARAEGLTLISADARMAAYDVPLIPA